MKPSQKTDIQAKLKEYCAKYDSQNKAANSLKGVSAGTISQIINNNWDLISDEMWNKVSKQVGHSSKELIIVKTANYKAMTSYLKDAANNSRVSAIVSDPGSSKSVCAKDFVLDYQRAYRLECMECWNRKHFLYELLSVIGGDASGMNVTDMLQEIVRMLKAQDSPLIILDEFDKVNDQILYFFISLYNQLQDECGIVVCSTDHLKKRIERGLKLNKKGYKEFYSRVGRKFIVLPGVMGTDIDQICMANGITNKKEIEEVIKDSEFDLRRVKTKIHAIRNAS